MILVASQRGGARALAAHLLNTRDNDHVTVEQIRGFVGTTVRDAFDEADAIAKATKARQFLFSLSLSPPKGADLGMGDFLAAIDRAERAVGLSGQPRVVVVHEKHGRKHTHVVWSRTHADTLTAINLPFFKTRLNDLSKELYLEHGWELPEGHRTNDWKNPLNFTLAEWQQAKRLELDPREIKQAFRDAWMHSDNLGSFRYALQERGYFLAKGDRRGFVALDIHGEPFAIARWTGLKAKEVEARLGSPEGLSSVEDVRRMLKQQLTDRLKSLIREHRQAQQDERAPLVAERSAMVAQQRTERDRLRHGQDQRWRQEAQDRAARLRGGLRGVLDILTGRARLVRQQNEREALQAFRRDRDQQEALAAAQAKERRVLQDRFDAIAERQREDRRTTGRRIAALIRRNDPPPPPPALTRARPFRRRPDRGHSFSR